MTLRTALAGLLLVSSLGAPSALRAADALPVVIMKLGTAAQHDHQTEFLERYKAAVEKDSKGRIQAQIFAAGVLGSIPRMIEDVQFGSVQGWMGTPSFLSGIDRRFEITELPLFGDPHPYLDTILDPAFATPFLAMGTDKGLHPVTYAYSGEAGLVLRKPVSSLADLKGLKIRCTPNAIEESELRLLGVTPVPMPLDQVLPALQQGAIDGVVITIGVASPLKYYSVAKYFYDMGLVHTINIVTLSGTWYAKQPPDLQAILNADAPKIARAMFDWTLTFNDQQKKEWTAGGGTIIPISKADRATFLSAIRPVGEDVTSKDPAEHQLFVTLMNTASKHGYK
jgi:TRAP-type C4-dicarboxylate transport system substrate-binding protein